jgi:hypothetical protein
MEGTLSADPTELPPVQPTIALTGNEWAPFIYCDGVSALGTQAGAIQIELAARTILPAEMLAQPLQMAAREMNTSRRPISDAVQPQL